MKRKWTRRLAIAGGALVLAVVFAVLAGKYWLVPFILRREISAALQKQWDGPLTISGVHFNWTGPLYLRGVELRDAAGREWLRAGSVKLTLSNWPGLHPVLGKVEVEDLGLQGHFAGGALQLPLKPAPKSQGGESAVELPSIIIRNISIGLIADGNTILACGGLQITIRPERQRYRIELKRITNAPGEELFVTGTFEGKSLETDLTITVKHAIIQKDAVAIFAAFHAPFVTQADGTLDMNVNLRGRLFDLPSSFASMMISGAIVLSGASVSCARGALATDLRGAVRFSGQAPPGATAEWSASFCQGRAKGNLTANVLGGGAVKYHGKADAQGINFDEMSKLLGGGPETRQGKLQCIYVMDGRTDAPKETAGRGYVYLADAHLGDVPLLTSLFSFMGISQFDALQSTDAEATFAVKGLVVTLSKARVSNAVAAIEVEPGGQVDIEKHSLDLYAIVAPVKQLHDMLASIPLVKLVVQLQDKLMRVRVHGDWDAAPASLISNESLSGIKEIGEGTVDFLRSAASSGGRLGKTLYGEFGESVAP